MADIVSVNRADDVFLLSTDDQRPLVDAVLSGEKRGRPIRSLSSDSRGTGGHQRSRDRRLSTETTLHQSMYQGHFKVTLHGVVICPLLLIILPSRGLRVLYFNVFI